MQLESLNQFSVIKQGDTKNEFMFKILDYNNVPVDLTDKTVKIIIANSIGKVLEKAPVIDPVEIGVISFKFADGDVTGYGDMRLEIHVTDSNGTQIIPSDGYYKFVINRNLDDVSTGVTNYTLQYFTSQFDSKMAEFNTSMQTIEGATTNANTAATNANEKIAEFQTTEMSRTTAETMRSTNETEREESETQRKLNESTRESIEIERIANENTRQDNETTRQANESKRQTDTSQAIINTNIATSEANTARDNANSAANLANEKASLADASAINANQKAVELEQKVNQAIAAGTVDLEVKDARGGESTIGVRLDKINGQLVQTDRQTQTISHGTQIINGEEGVSSPVQVEFYGDTKINIWGNSKASFTPSVTGYRNNIKTAKLSTGYYILVVRNVPSNVNGIMIAKNGLYSTRKQY